MALISPYTLKIFTSLDSDSHFRCRSPYPDGHGGYAIRARGGHDVYVRTRWLSTLLDHLKNRGVFPLRNFR